MGARVAEQAEKGGLGEGVGQVGGGQQAVEVRYQRGMIALDQSGERVCFAGLPFLKKLFIGGHLPSCIRKCGESMLFVLLIYTGEQGIGSSSGQCEIVPFPDVRHSLSFPRPSDIVIPRARMNHRLTTAITRKEKNTRAW